MAITQITSVGIKDGEIVNADLHSSAAIALSKLGTTGTAANTTFLRGDGAWSAISGVDISNLNANNLSTGTVPDARFPSTLPAVSGANLTNVNATTVDSRDTSSSGGANVVVITDGSGNTSLGSGTITANGSGLSSLNASNLSSGTVAAARLDTATTQSAGNNSTKIATTAYADTAVSNLVDSAPGALNTLNELAAALGDDANFSTTITNSIATKLPLAGGTLTGALQINGVLTTNGTHNFLQGSSSSHSTITLKKSASGADSIDYLQCRNSSNTLIAKIGGSGDATFNATVTANSFSGSGANLTGISQLKHGGSSKFSALSGGVKLDQGHFDADDSSRIRLGDSDDLQLFHASGHSNIENSTGTLHIKGDAIALGAKSVGENLLIATEGSSVELFFDGAKTVETGVNQLTLYGNSSECNLEFKTSDNTRRAFIGSTNGNNITFYSGGSEKIWHYANNAQIELYYDDAKKAETFNSGFRISGGGELHIDGNATGGHCQLVMGRSDRSWMIANETHLRIYTQSGNNSHPNVKVLEFGNGDTGQLTAIGNSAFFRTNESGGASVEIRSGGSEGYVGTQSNHKISFVTNANSAGDGGRRWEISGAGHFIPRANNTYDIGASGTRVRNVYTNDLNLSNEGSTNDVDGTWGSFTIQEGENDLFLLNRRNGKKYKFNLTEVN